MKWYLILFWRALFELAKRIIFIFLFIPAYLVRKWARDYNARYFLALLLWLTLDDTINAEGVGEYGLNIEYCAYGKRFKPFELLPDCGLKEFLRAWHWSAWRNSGVNLSWYFGAGKKIELRYKIGAIEIRLFEKKTLPYFEKIIFGFYFQIGWISNGRFEMEIKRI